MFRIDRTLNRSVQCRAVIYPALDVDLFGTGLDNLTTSASVKKISNYGEKHEFIRVYI